jgi:hypothetical protein
MRLVRIPQGVPCTDWNLLCHCASMPRGLPAPIMQEAKLKLENLKTHKDAAHKLRCQMASGRNNVAAAEVGGWAVALRVGTHTNRALIAQCAQAIRARAAATKPDASRRPGAPAQHLGRHRRTLPRTNSTQWGQLLRYTCPAPPTPANRRRYPSCGPRWRRLRARWRRWTRSSTGSRPSTRARQRWAWGLGG